MRWAIALALEGLGRTSPNPMVGAVVVRRGRIVGEGYHHMAGASHAEVGALKKAGPLAKGAELYVTLEPCCHYGRTPPCVDAIIKAGVKRVFVGARDPNPIVRGRGSRHLRKAGIKVVEGVLEASCLKINEAYNKHVVSGMPFVTVKVAVSLDGKIATASGQSRWITNKLCRRYVHRLRSISDAVIVGGNTVRMDDPRLDVRLSKTRGRAPIAVVVEERLNVRRSARLLKRPKGSVFFITTDKAPKSMLNLVRKKGHEIIICPQNAADRVSLPHALRELGKRGVVAAMVEGGGELFADFFRNRLVDRVVACIAPKLIGGEGRDFLPGIKTSRLVGALKLHDVQVQVFGDNVVVEGAVV